MRGDEGLGYEAVPLIKDWPEGADAMAFYSRDGFYLGEVSRKTAEAMEKGEEFEGEGWAELRRQSETLGGFELSDALYVLVLLAFGAFVEWWIR